MKVEKANNGEAEGERGRERARGKRDVLFVLNCGNVKSGLVGQHDTAWGQPLITCEEDGVQHGLVEEEIACEPG